MSGGRVRERPEGFPVWDSGLARSTGEIETGGLDELALGADALEEHHQL
jgi:hypothetical protein